MKDNRGRENTRHYVVIYGVPGCLVGWNDGVYLDGPWLRHVMMYIYTCVLYNIASVGYVCHPVKNLASLGRKNCHDGRHCKTERSQFVTMTLSMFNL